ncbi:hypothetical protein GQR58_027581 [Nymphon striatum]|nr:hypothetical protein GQR58_027581 [Nymphon striatum]
MSVGKDVGESTLSYAHFNSSSPQKVKISTGWQKQIRPHTLQVLHTTRTFHPTLSLNSEVRSVHTCDSFLATLFYTGPLFSILSEGRGIISLKPSSIREESTRMHNIRVKDHDYQDPEVINHHYLRHT